MHTLLSLFALSGEGAGLASEPTDLQFAAVCQAADRWEKQCVLRRAVATVGSSAAVPAAAGILKAAS